MYNNPSFSKFKSKGNVCKIDLNDLSDRQKQINNPTVNKKTSNFSPVSHNPMKNSSSFNTLLSQLQPATTKSFKNYSQQKQMLISKKNELIKNAIKQSLNSKKPGTSKPENWEYSHTNMPERYGKENEVPAADGRIKSRERMDQFYYNMRHARPVSVAKQSNLDRTTGISAYISPKNRSYMQKAVIPNSTVNLSGISNQNESKTANTTIIKYNVEHNKENNSFIKGRSFDLKHDSSPSNKQPIQNRILLDLDESLNLAPPLDQVKTANTTAHAKSSKSREEIQNILALNSHQPINTNSYFSKQHGYLPCKIIRDQEFVERQNQRDHSPEKDLFEINDMSPIKSNNRDLSLNNISSGNINQVKGAKNLANQPYPTIIKQINLNSNTPTSVGKPPLHNYPQQSDYYSNIPSNQELQQQKAQEAVKHKNLNIQTVKENKKIEFPNYLQNLTCDRQKYTQDFAFHQRNRTATPDEIHQRAPLQPAALNFTESLNRNRISEENSREYPSDKRGNVDSHFRFPGHDDQGNSKYLPGNRPSYYGECAKNLDTSHQILKNLHYDSTGDNTNKNQANTSASGRPQIDIGPKRGTDILTNEILPQSVKGNLPDREKHYKDVNDYLLKKENKTPQNQNQFPTNFSSKNPANEDKELVRRQSGFNDINILDFDPEEKEARIKKYREEYVIGKQIGQGAYATVRIGLHKPTNTKVAIKIYEKAKIMDPMRRRSVRREIKLMQRMDHPNIIKILDIVETNNHMNIVMEYIGGASLHSFLKAQPNRRLKEEHAFSIFKQAVAGIYYCHARCITHRDIKLENMLLDNNGNLKIIDFGFSTCIPNDKKVRMFCGTPSYMAPEIVTKIEYCGPPADIWALGVLLFALLCGTFPFKGENDKELYRKISKGEFIIPDFVSDKAASLIMKMINIDPEKRPTAKEVMNEPWYVMHTFMEKKQERRITCRSSSAAEEAYFEKAENKASFPLNINTGHPIPDQPFIQINNFLKSPPYNMMTNNYEKPISGPTHHKEDDLSRELLKHLSPSHYRSLTKYTTPTAQNNNVYIDNKNMVYNINLRDNSNRSYGNKDANETDVLAPDDNFDENRLKCKKTLNEIEVWNIPANLSSEKSFKRDSGKNSYFHIISNIQNRSLKKGEENSNIYEADIINNLIKMGYKEEEISQNLRDRTGPIYSVFNRMLNEKRALQFSNHADSINSDQNNNSFNLSSKAALKRKSLNLWIHKNLSQGNQGKENMYMNVQKTTSTKDFTGNQDEVLKPISTNTTRKEVLGEIVMS